MLLCIRSCRPLYYLKPNKTENLLERFGSGHGKGRGIEYMLLSVSIALNMAGRRE